MLRTDIHACHIYVCYVLPVLTSPWGERQTAPSLWFVPGAFHQALWDLSLPQLRSQLRPSDGDDVSDERITLHYTDDMS